MSTPDSVPHTEKAPKMRISSRRPCQAELLVQHLAVEPGAREEVGDHDDDRHALDEVDDQVESRGPRCSWPLVRVVGADVGEQLARGVVLHLDGVVVDEDAVEVLQDRASRRSGRRAGCR